MPKANATWQKIPRREQVAVVRLLRRDMRDCRATGNPAGAAATLAAIRVLRRAAVV